ncbi:MAG: helix-turn-helix domain-containing protein [Acutalibacteraceae bacterium]
MRINEKIYRLRKQYGWSQDELAEKLSVSRQSVSKWETGDSIPEPAKIITIAKLFSVSADYLIDDTQEKYIPPEATKSIDTADRVFNKTEELFSNYGWILGLVLFLFGLWRFINAIAGIVTFSGAGAFSVIGAAAFIPFLFTFLISIAMMAGGIIMIKKLRKKRSKKGAEKESEIESL